MDALAGSPDVFETFFQQVGVGLALADLESGYVRVNDAYASLLGRRPEEFVGLSFRDLLHPEGRAGSDSSLDLLMRGEEATLTAEERYVREDGDELWVLHSVTAVRDASGAPVWFAVSAQDITERHRAEQTLHELTASLTERAVRDPLTGLANRALLAERLRGALARDARTGGRTGLLFLDLDGFKAVNDQHGHGVGDDVLRGVASRLLAGVRPSDTVARLGGDEFVVLVEGVTEEGLTQLATRLEAAVQEPYDVGVRVQVGASVGSALSHGGEADPAGLIGRADRGMYEVKRDRRG
ncbi:MAG: hypothetical protein JWM64_1998 [Frankiales bacterium]|nr:hypothetical protein [Frankiales bacterium]